MLPYRHRITRGEDFRRVLSRGVKSRTPLGLIAVSPGAASHSRFGFIVSKAVGTAVTRNATKRMLRAASADWLSVGSPVDVVVRAAPGVDQMSVADAAAMIGRAIRTSSPR